VAKPPRDDGGECAAFFYTLICTAKTNGRNSEPYWKEKLSGMRTMESRWFKTRLGMFAILIRMPRSATASHHLDLYRYWLAKCGGRPIPARRDIDPTEIPALLPYLGIIENADGQLRYRLIGTALGQQIGRDVTGGAVGSYIPAAPGLRATVELVCTVARPVFNTGRLGAGFIHNSSALLLPLSEDGTAVNMIVFLYLTHFQPYGWASPDWLGSAPVSIGEPAIVEDAAHIEKLVADWEYTCTAPPNPGG
jgi:hypothetical protein